MIILVFGIGATLLLWLIPRSLPDVEVVSGDSQPYGPGAITSRGVRYSSFVDDAEYVFIISSDDLPDTKDFSVTKPAPLAISEVVSLARDSFEQYFSEGGQQSWRLDSVSLHHIGQLKWYYIASFRPLAGGVNSDGSMKQLSIPVLFNRNVINGVARQSARDKKRDLEIAAKAVGVTTEELVRRRSESVENIQGCHDVSLISNVDTKIFRFEIPSETLSELEDYDITEPLPLAIHEASAAALKICKLYIPAGQSMKWQIEKISFCRWGNSDKWYYLVDFRSNGGMNGIVTPQLLIPVLLNGEVVRGVSCKS